MTGRTQHPALEPPAEAVVFDLFRTLVCPELLDPNSYRRAQHLAEALGIDAGPLTRWYAETKVERNRSREPSFAARLHDFCGRSGTPRSLDRIEAVLDAVDRFHSQAIRSPVPEVLRTIDELHQRGFKVGVLSNTDEHEIRSWPGSPLSKLVDAAALSVDIGFVKPEPGAYRWILEALGGIPPGRAVYVGDGESQELVGAKREGFRLAVFMRGFVATTGFQTPEKLRQFAREADRTIDSIPEVLDLVGSRRPK